MVQDTIILALQPRTVTGKAVKHLRKAGIVPAVIHDHGKASLVVQGSYLDVAKVYRRAGKHHPVQVKVGGGKQYTALIKTATFEPKKNLLSHLVLNAVKANEKVQAEVPVRPRYDEGNESAPAERAGLLVIDNIDTVEVEAVPSSLPDALEYDGERLIEVGDHVTVGDLLVPDGVVILTEPEQVVATVYEPSAVAAANDALAGEAETEPEEVTSEHGTPAEDVANEAAGGGSTSNGPKNG